MPPERTKPDPVILRAIDVEWAASATKSMRYAVRCVGPDEAEDLMQEAYLAIREGRRAWNREAYPTFFAFAASVMRSLAGHERRSAKTRREASVGDPDATAPPSATNPERLVMMRQEQARLAEMKKKLAAAVAADEQASALIALAEEGVVGRAEIMARLGLCASDVIAARKRLAYAMDQIKESEKRKSS
jgi:DNA-directed RNA polymerase specialized sigma24 family protein